MSVVSGCYSRVFWEVINVFPWKAWVSYLNMGVLLSTLSLALFNASNDAVSLIFAYIYAFISLAVLVYGYVVYQRRITRIRKRDPGHFGMFAHFYQHVVFLIYFSYRPDSWPMSHMRVAVFRSPLKFYHKRSVER